MLDARGRVRDLSGVIDDLEGDLLARLSDFANDEFADDLPVVETGQRLGVPVAGVGKFIGIGLNYSDHAAEAGMAEPSEPIIFMKATSALSGPNDALHLPRGSTKTDWEVELGVVIGARAKYVREADALNHVAGYVIVNDVSERSYQLERSGQWTKGKSCDSFGPVGPWLVTPDQVGDVQNLGLSLAVNGQGMQHGNTGRMIFGVAHVIAYLSQMMTLHPGDIIATGTPPGVGMGLKPPRYLQAGDEVVLSIDGLGEQRQQVVAD